MTTSEAVAFLRRHDDYLILTHRNPDGDTLGSAAGLCQALREYGKIAYLMKNAQTTRAYEPRMTDYWAVEGFMPACIVSVDVASINMLQLEAEGLEDRIELSIDHHPSNTMFGTEDVVMPEKAACGEIIYEIARELGGGVSADTAGYLYIAISTDTGCFRYGNTNAETLRAASELAAAGAPIREINRQIFMTKTKSRLMLEGKIINGLRFYRDDKICVNTLSTEMIIECGAGEEDLEDMASLAVGIEGVEVGITIREKPEGMSRISVRTVREADASRICALLGGGGHVRASGCTVDCGLDEAREKILAAINEVWPE